MRATRRTKKEVFVLNEPIVKARDASFDTIRGIVCLLVVFFHMVGGGSGYGMRIPLDDPLQRFNALFIFVRMPVFAMMAGFFWRYQPGEPSALWLDIRKRLQHVVLPIFAAGLLFYLGHAMKHEGGLSLRGAVESLFGNATYLWFLQSLSTLMIGSALLSFVLKDWRKIAFILLIPISMLIYSQVDRYAYSVWSWRNTFYLAPYFFTGVLLQDFLKPPRTQLQRVLGAVLLAVAMALGSQFTEFSIHKALAAIIGLTGALGMLNFRPVLGLLAKLGPHSYGVYLYHIFFTNLIILLWRKFIPEAPTVPVALFGLAVAVSGPILMKKVLGWVPPLRVVVFGK